MANINGTSLNDILNGTIVADNIKGLNGDDSLFGNAGNDTLDGGNGSNIMLGGDGDDTIISRGIDFIDGGNGVDFIRIERVTSLSNFNFSLKDSLSGLIGLGDGTQLINAERIAFNGGNGNDVVTGGDFADILNAGGGVNTLRGGKGNDALTGVNAGDKLYGDAGDDRVETAGVAAFADGGDGKDTLTINLTKAQWLDSGVQQDLSGWRTHIMSPAIKDNIYTFDDSFLLQAKSFESGKVFVDGIELSLKDDPVTAVADAGYVNEGAMLNGNVLNNDTVPDLVKSVVIDTGPAYGTVTIGDDGNYIYNANANIPGLNFGDTLVDSFTYKVTDADGDIGLATVSVSIYGIDESVGNLLVDFEDIEGLTGSGSPLPDEYKGFNWQAGGNTVYALNGANYGSFPGSGYELGGIPAGGNVAYTPFASKPVTITRVDASDFDFNSVYLTSAWDDVQHVTATGFNDGVEIGQVEIDINNDGPTQLAVDWANIDTLVINSVTTVAGGGTGGSGSHFVMDNFDFFV